MKPSLPATITDKFDHIIATNDAAAWAALDQNEKDWFEAYKWQKMGG
jgi:hypothetical protein